VAQFPEFLERARKRFENIPELVATIQDPRKPGYDNRHLLSILNEEKLRRVLACLLDENEFLSPYGIRSLSRYHQDNPYIFRVQGEEFKVDYVPADSNTGMFGGNSNWRGPIWFPVNILILRALTHYYLYYGDDFKVECPTGSGTFMTLFEVFREITRRLSKIFLPDKEGHRPVYGGSTKFQSDPYWRDYIQFFEFFHGDNGAGVGASHQTGWTGLIAKLIQMENSVGAAEFLKEGLHASIKTVQEDEDDDVENII
jgi:hypothetical protein